MPELSRRQLMGWLAAAAAPPLVAPGIASAASTVTVWLPLPTDKVRRDRALPSDLGARISLRAARNEYESGQLILRAPSGATQVGVSVSALTGPATIPADQIAVFEQRYIEVKSSENSKYGPGWYPDALVPLQAGARMTVGPGTNTGVWLTVRIPKGQPPGRYTGTVTITGADSPIAVPIDLEVWGFELPDTPSTDTACAIWYPQVGAAHGVQFGNPAYAPLMKRYFDFQLEHRLMSDDIPVRGNPGPGPAYPPGPGPDPEPDEFIAHADEFLHDRRIRRFRIPLYASGDNDSGFTVDTNKLGDLVDRLRAKGLIDRGYFYYADEPTTDAAYEHVRRLFATVDAVAPDVPHVLTLERLPRQDLLDFVRAWAFVVTVPKPELPGIVAALKARGDLVWWYTAYGHGWPIPGVFIHDSLVGHRLLPWIQHNFGIEGYLFWSTTVFGKWDGRLYHPVDRWVDPVALTLYAGDGYLMYPGKSVGIDGPVGTVRLHGLREGFEDAEYLALYERRAAELAAQWGVEFPATRALQSYHDVLHDWLTPYQDVPGLFDQIRAQVGAEVGQLFGPAPALVDIPEPTAHHVPVTAIVAKGTEVTIDGIPSEPVGGTAAADIHRVVLDTPAAGLRDITVAAGPVQRITRTVKIAPVATPHEVIVNSFETDVDLARVTPSNVTVTRSDQHATTGRWSAKLVYAANVDNAGVFFYTGYDGPVERAIGRPDWSTIDAVALDIYNDSDQLVVVDANFYDPVRLDNGNPFYLSPRKLNSVVLPLTGLVNDLSRITSLELRAHRRGTPLTLYVDNLRLLRSRTGLPSPGTWARGDVLHVVRTDGTVAIGRQTGTDPAGWQFEVPDDPALRGPYRGTVASAVDPARRLNFVALGDSGPLQWCQEDGAWSQRAVDPVPDNGPRPQLVGVPAAALDAHGRLTYFARSADGFLVHGWQEVPGSQTWRATYLSDAGGTRLRVTGDPAAIQDPSGKLTFFARTTGDELLHGWQLIAGEPQWNAAVLPVNLLGRPAVAQGISGRLCFHARHPSGAVIHGWQSTPGSGPWRWALLPRTTNTDDGGSPVTVTIAGDPAAGLDAGGRLTYFARTTDGTIFHSWQRVPDGGPWDATVIRAGGAQVTVAGDGALTQDGAGRLHYFARTAAGTLRHCWQDAPGTGPWHATELGSGIAS